MNIIIYNFPKSSILTINSMFQVKTAKLHLLGSVSSLVSVQLNHFQLLFLLRMVEMIAEMSAFLGQDVRHILGEEDEGSVAIGVVAPQINLNLVMPAVVIPAAGEEEQEDEPDDMRVSQCK